MLAAAAPVAATARVRATVAAFLSSSRTPRSGWLVLLAEWRQHLRLQG